MVSKVYGKADGVDITFYHDHGDIWQIDVPMVMMMGNTLRKYSRRMMVET